VAIIALAAFGVLWGGWGLLLAIPVLAVVKTIGDHLDGGHAWAIWLGPVPVQAEASSEPVPSVDGALPAADGMDRRDA
jgi:hypothetical protein